MDTAFETSKTYIEFSIFWQKPFLFSENLENEKYSYHHRAIQNFSTLVD